MNVIEAQGNIGPQSSEINSNTAYVSGNANVNQENSNYYIGGSNYGDLTGIKNAMSYIPSLLMGQEMK